MKKFITAVFCTALALSSGLTAYAAEALDEKSTDGGGSFLRLGTEPLYANPLQRFGS